jgi:hypothetical protein
MEVSMQATVPIDITKMDATIPEGIDLLLKGIKVNSGPLEVRLDREARSQGANCGELDYDRNVARARFNVSIVMTGVARLLGRAVQPIRAVVDTEGVMTEDHNFGLSGPMEIQPHPLFEFSAAVLPGR